MAFFLFKVGKHAKKYHYVRLCQAFRTTRLPKWHLTLTVSSIGRLTLHNRQLHSLFFNIRPPILFT